MAEVLVIGKKISEMGLVNEVTGEEKIPTSALGDKAVTTGQLLTYVNNNGVAQWGRIGGDIANQADLQSQFTQQLATLQSHIQDQGNPHNVTKEQVGLGLADNTADMDKPVSTAVQEALSLKADQTYVDDSLANKTHNSFLGRDADGAHPASAISYGDGSVSDFLDSKVVKIVETIAELRSLSDVKEGDVVKVRGFHAGNSDLAQHYEGGGDFLWVGDSVVTPVQGIIEKVTGITTGRFLRQFDGGVINVLWCGARRDGVTETHTELKVALQYAIDNDMQCYAPKGTYLLGNRVDPTFSNGKSLYFYGDGMDQTIFKERDGLTAEIGRYNYSFFFSAASGVTINSIVLKDFKVDKNGHTSMLTQAVIDAQGLYAYEQAHCIGIIASWTNAKIKLCNIDNIETTDKVGAGLCFMAGVIETAIVNNITGTNWQHNGGQRGDFEFQSTIKNLTVNNGRGLYAQCEPDVAAPPDGGLCRAEFNNCSYDSSEFTAFRSAPTKQHIYLSNHTALTKLTLGDLKATVSNSVFKVGSGNHEFWYGLVKGSVVEDSEIIVRIDTVNNQTSPFYVRSSFSSNNPSNLRIRGGVIRPDDTANSSTTGLAIYNANAHNGTVEQKLILEDVAFDPMFEGTIRCHGNGDYEIRRCKLAGRSSFAVMVGGYTSYLSNVVLEDNDLSQINGDYINFVATNTLWSLTIKGVHDFAKSGFSSSNLANTELCSKSEGYFTSDVVPAGKGMLGWRVRFNKPKFGTGSEFICTTMHSASAVYQLSEQAGVKMDTTDNRPTGLTTASRGLRYLDTTLAVGGKPIQYNGTVWTDSLGVTV